MHYTIRSEGNGVPLFTPEGNIQVPMRHGMAGKNLGICVCMVILFSGCISTTVTSYEEGTRNVYPRDYSIPVIDLAHEVRPYTVIGYIEIKASELYSTETIFRKMRNRARRMGGDALSDIIQQPVDKKFPFFFDYLNFYGNIWSAEVIAWEDE